MVTSRRAVAPAANTEGPSADFVDEAVRLATHLATLPISSVSSSSGGRRRQVRRKDHGTQSLNPTRRPPIRTHIRATVKKRQITRVSLAPTLERPVHGRAEHVVSHANCTTNTVSYHSQHSDNQSFLRTTADDAFWCARKRYRWSVVDGLSLAAGFHIHRRFCTPACHLRPARRQRSVARLRGVPYRRRA